MINSSTITLLRFHTNGMLGIVFLLLICIMAYSTHNIYANHQERLNTLEQDTYQLQKKQIKAEVAAAKNYIYYMNNSAERER